MIWNFIALMFPLAVAIVAAALYKSERTFMLRFYVAMTESANARKLYTQCLLVLLLVFHYVYVSGHFGDFGVLPSTILCAVMFSHKRTDRWLHRLHENRRTFVMLAAVALAIAAVPHGYTMSVTLALLLLAAMFYPSYRILSEWKTKENRELWTEHPQLIAGFYF